MRTGLVVSVLVLATACQPAQRAVTVEKAWVRLAAVPANPSVAYFTLRGGARDETLTAVAAPAATRAEMHESMAGNGGMMSMTPIKLVAIRAGGEVTFAPGGKHVMLFGLKPDIKPGTTTSLTFTLSNGQTITTSAKVVGAGDNAYEGN